MSKPTPEPLAPTRHSAYTWAMLGGYTLLLIYGSLYPLSQWRSPQANPLLLILSPSRYYSYADILTNLLVYMPFGLLLILASRRRGVRAIVLATVLGAGLSLSMEYIQAYLPSRVPSFMDLLLNTFGALAGSVLAHALNAETRIGHALHRLRATLCVAGGLGNLGLAALALWCLSQLTPLVPSIDVSVLRAGLSPLWHSLTGTRPLDYTQLLSYACAASGLMLLSYSLLTPAWRKTAYVAGVFYAVLLLKIVVVSRQLSMEALLGITAGFIVLLAARRLPATVYRLAGAIAILGTVVFMELQTGNPTAPLPSPFNWIPFRAQMGNDLIGIIDILVGIWPFMALAYFARQQWPEQSKPAVFGGAGAIFLIMLWLEWQQRYLPGRSPDVTDAIIPVFTWILARWHPIFRIADTMHSVQTEVYRSARSTIRHESCHRRKKKPARIVIAVVLAVAVLVIAGMAMHTRNLPERGLDESTWPRLAPAEKAPRASFKDFHWNHPRLPAPSLEDIINLERHNPGYLRRQLQRAKGGNGELYAVILSAYVKPGSQDMNILFQRLMALKITWRGHNQTKPIAQAYDWLYDQWTAAQRKALLGKVIEAANYEIDYIRKERLSPYNVYLYNSPLQALMAAAIASYTDSPQADRVMNFTADFWLHRVLPVWRQVMGKNGGWHEGGEYVGIGIGQAVYELPAMWKKATGENIFDTEPELNGFLDFLVYRRRPDNTDFRLGDAAFFHRNVPERIPLAIVYRNKPAYSLDNKPRYEPTSWPWGPLPDDSLYDPLARQQLPLTRFFDGIGLLVIRSDWAADATYLTFKAGDNYWSHSHLDQGSFTIYKGGALAVDSGLYGSHYGSDHHMNYTYQSIAHNVVTVTDPDDTVKIPARKKKPEREIANDGGQRRVGSGWGISPAPLDKAEWEKEYALYHTGKILKLYDKNGITVAVADLTPAYTNALSGKGTFTNRTLRVKSYTRIFAYDMWNDTVIVYDDIVTYDPQFRTKWLLHSRFMPQVNRHGFEVMVPAGEKTGQSGGDLYGTVILPRRPNINLVGGKGFEFFVDGKNHDENGKIWALVKNRLKDAEPGRWRIELTDQTARRNNHFLVVLQPRLTGAIRESEVVPVYDGADSGCEIRGKKFASRWIFSSTGHSIKIRTIENGIVKNIQVDAP